MNSINASSLKFCSNISENIKHEITNYKIFQAVFIVLTMIFGIVGNLIVIFVIFKVKKMRTVTNLYLLNVSIADCMYLLAIPVNLVTFLSKEWKFNGLVCKFYWFLTFINQFTAIFILTSLAFDRYLAVCHPIGARWWRRHLNPKINLVLNWFLGLLCMLPILIYSNVEVFERPLYQNSNSTCLSTVCTILWPSNWKFNTELYFIVYSVIIGFLIPIVVIVYFYSSIVKKLWKKRVILSYNAPARRKKRFKIAIIVLSIISIYTISYTPYWILQIYLTLSSISGFELNHDAVSHVSFWFQWLIYLNSALNPYVYGLLSENFQVSLKKILKIGTESLNQSSRINQNGNVGEFDVFGERKNRLNFK